MQRERLTPERIRRFTCPEGMKQVFLWDTVAPRLSVRATAGAKAFVFEGKLNRRTIRITIGDVRTWVLEDARTEARRLQTLVDQGTDPRQEKADRIAAAEARREEQQRASAPALEAWAAYLEARQPKWGRATTPTISGCPTPAASRRPEAASVAKGIRPCPASCAPCWRCP
ncbi:Arm DNA-binding domain-containing protein [Thauera sp. SDU_THAU2]|uniref:Arm DNA-binding domain-containing protein n=1 Tax=Thauera sp. SDU_THAU2 TaxID=3136633 RepID=UPI00312048D8